MYINRLQLHPYLQDYVDALPGAEPAAGYYQALNNVVRYLVNSGLWQAWLSFGVLATNSVANALVDLRNPANRFSLVGSPGSFTPYASMAGDGVSFHLDTHINPHTSLAVLDHMFGLHGQADIVSGTGGNGVRDATGQIALQLHRTTTQAAVWSCSVGATVVTSASGIGFKAIGRTQSNVARFYLSDTALNVNITAAGLPNANFYLFRQGISRGWSAAALSCFFIGHSQGVTDAMVAGFRRVWQQALIAFQTLAVPPTPQVVAPPNAFRAATHAYTTPPDLFVIRQFPPMAPDDVSNAATTFANDPIDVAVSRPWTVPNSTSTTTRMQLAELVWGDRNNFAPPPLNKPNDTNGAISYTVPGQLAHAVMLNGGSGYVAAPAPTFRQLAAAGFACTLGVTAGAISSASISSAGQWYPASGTLTVSDSAGSGAVIGYTADPNTGAVTALIIADGGQSYSAPAGSIVVPTGSADVQAVVSPGGAINSVLIIDQGSGFPLTGFFTFDPGASALGAFSAANTVYPCQPEFTSYDTSEISTDVKLAITAGLKYHRDTRHPQAWGWRNYLVRVAGLYDSSPWDALYNAQCFDQTLDFTGGFGVGTPGGIVDAGAAALPYAILVDLEVGTAFAGPTGAQLYMTLQTASATSGPWTALANLPAIDMAQLSQAGWQMPTYRYSGSGQLRYLQLVYLVSGGPMTAGTITTNAPLDAFRLQGNANLGTCSPWGYWHANASATLFPHGARNGATRTCYDSIILGQSRLCDLHNVPLWGFAVDCEMDDDAGPVRFQARVQRWVDIVRATGFKIYLGMDPIVGGAGARVGMTKDNANDVAQLVDFVNIGISSNPPNGDQLTFINNQIDVYRGPDGDLDPPVAHLMMQLSIGNPVMKSAYIAVARSRQDELGITTQVITPTYATLGGPSSRDVNQAIIQFCQIAPAGVFA
jgi:hypothetical protein